MLHFAVLHKLVLNVKLLANVLQVKTGKTDTIFYRRRQSSCRYDYNLQVK